MDDEWYYLQGGKTHGPFAESVMRTWLKKGYLPEDVKVCRGVPKDGAESFRSLNSFDESPLRSVQSVSSILSLRAEEEEEEEEQEEQEQENGRK